MNKLTYIEARDKIWAAYFRDEIKPNDCKFCFCGTLADGRGSWSEKDKFRQHLHNYAWNEYGQMEKALFSFFPTCTWSYNGLVLGASFIHLQEDYEEKLFSGMLAALEVLKQIHRDRGDYIPEDEPLLTKRTIEKPKVANL